MTNALDKVASWRTKAAVWIGLPVVAVLGLVFGSADVIPAWQAKSGTGTTGTFTADREDCGRRSCSFYGTFVPADGGATRSDVILYDEPDSLRVRGTTEAIDSGARKGVFATAGGITYLLVTGITLVGAAAAIVWLVLVVRALRRRANARPGTATAGATR